MDVIQECVYQKQQVLSWFIHHRYAVGINRTTHYISQSRVETPSRRGEQFYCSFVANLLQYLYAKNYQNTMRFDKVIAKNRRVHFLPHSVDEVSVPKLPIEYNKHAVNCCSSNRCAWPRRLDIFFKSFLFAHILSASLYVSKRGAYWDKLCRDVVGWLVVTVAKRCILGL